MQRRLLGGGSVPPYVIIVVAVLLLGLGTPASAGPRTAATLATQPRPVPSALTELPARIQQAVRVIRSDRYCTKVWCTVVQSWQRDSSGAWQRVRTTDGTFAVRGQIGYNGFAPQGEKLQGDGHTPNGVYDIVTAFSTDDANPGTAMPWRQRKPTSSVTGYAGELYNTWIEEAGRTDGDRPAMRYGFWINYNHGRLEPGVGPAPVQGRGSGIFLHTIVPGHPFEPTLGCVAVRPAKAWWLLRWLDPAANPRVLLNR